MSLTKTCPKNGVLTIDKLLFEKLSDRDVKVYYQDPEATINKILFFYYLD